MNGISFEPLISNIGKYGKIFISVAGLIILFPIYYKGIKRLRFTLNWLLLVIGVLLVLFAVYNYLYHSLTDMLIYNIVLPVYILFYILIIKLLLRIYKKHEKPNLIVSFEIFSLIQKTLLINLIFWIFISVILKVNMIDSIGNRSGFGAFFQDKVQFGLYCAVGFLISFYLQCIVNSKSKINYNLIQMLLYGCLLITTDSRNSQFIIVIAISYYILRKKIRYAIIPIILLVLLYVMLEFNSIVSLFSFNYFNQVTTGRLNIWMLALEEINSKGVFLGSGVFNLNSVVLSKNLGSGFYYLEELSFLYFHNSYIELLAAGGVIVLLLFFYLLYQSWLNLKLPERSIVLSLVIGGIFESYLVQPFLLISILFWFIILINSMSFFK